MKCLRQHDRYQNYTNNDLKAVQHHHHLFVFCFHLFSNISPGESHLDLHLVLVFRLRRAGPAWCGPAAPPGPLHGSGGSERLGEDDPGAAAAEAAETQEWPHPTTGNGENEADAQLEEFGRWGNKKRDQLFIFFRVEVLSFLVSD